MPSSAAISPRQVSRSLIPVDLTRKRSFNFINSADSEFSYFAGEDISANTLVYIDSDGLVKTSTYVSFPTVGIVTQDLIEDDGVQIKYSGEIKVAEHSFPIGSKLFLTSGSPNFSDTLPALSTGDIIQCIGFVIDADTIFLDIQEPIIIE